ncbi:MAG: hypothetical protein IPJ28_06850 [Betaproteobacteria bacterium]|nr:hypothetical protein [Betaproteobacteria bacterium]
MSSRFTLACAFACAGFALAAGPSQGADPAPAATAATAAPFGPVTMQRLMLVDAARHGSRIVAIGDRGYIVLSDDEGKTWRRAKSPPAPLLTAIAMLDAKTGWAVGHDSIILATTDGGENWVQQFSAPSEQRPLLDVHFLDKDRGYAIGAYGAFYETADGGRTWNPRKAIEDDKHLNAMLALEDGRLVVLGEAGTILLSADAGKTFTPVPSPYKGSLFGGVVAGDGSLVAFGLRGRIFRTTDGGKTWKGIDNASVATLMGGTRLPDGTLVLAGAGGTVLVSRDNGQSFGPLATGVTKAYAQVLLGAPNRVLLFGETGASEVPLPTHKK